MLLSTEAAAPYPPAELQDLLGGGGAGGFASAAQAEPAVGQRGSVQTPRPGQRGCELELAAATQQFVKWPSIQLILNPQIRPTLISMIDTAETSLRVTQCYLGDDALTQALCRARRDRGVSVDVVVDEGQCKHPCSASQPEQLRLLLEWRVDVRSFSPPGGTTALMHAKSWLADDCLAALGSSNATRNSMDFCWELIVFTRAEDVTRSLKSAFEDLWAKSAPLDLGMLPAPEKMAVRRSRSSSMTRSASASVDRVTLKSRSMDVLR